MERDIEVDRLGRYGSSMGLMGMQFLAVDNCHSQEVIQETAEALAVCVSQDPGKKVETTLDIST